MHPIELTVYDVNRAVIYENDHDNLRVEGVLGPIQFVYEWTESRSLGESSPTWYVGRKFVEFEISGTHFTADSNEHWHSIEFKEPRDA